MHLEYVAEWFDFAYRDLSSAEYLLAMRPRPLEIICYHCQQAAEKFLKGFLIYSGVDEPAKTHDLILLNMECSKFNNSFDEINQACDVLTRYGIQPRYPNEVLITDSDTDNAIKYARQIRDFEPLREIQKQIEQNI